MKDAQTGESLIGASVFITNEKSGTVTNDYGFYSVTIQQRDTIGIVFSYIGYQPQIKASCHMRLRRFRLLPKSLKRVVRNCS
jgi:CarboxypepD_reg-like domain